MCPPAHRRSQRKRRFSQITPDEHAQRHQLADGPLLLLCAPSSLRSCGAASVVMCCSSSPASSSAPSVLPEDRMGRNIIYVRPFCDHMNILHIFDQTCIVSTLSWRSRTGLPDLFSSSLVSDSLSDATAEPIASSHHSTLLCQV